jgi:GNAT superfamily N-acetyltransferase
MLCPADGDDSKTVRIPAFEISELGDRPEFFATVADRIWRAWGQPHGYASDQVVAALTDLLTAGDTIPFGVVAHQNGRFLGSALGLASDPQERLDYTPWIAAVWVEPAHRGRTIGRRLVARAADTCFARGRRRVYLCSAPSLRDFYVGQGWLPLEEAVGDRALIVYVKDAQ